MDFDRMDLTKTQLAAPAEHERRRFPRQLAAAQAGVKMLPAVSTAELAGQLRDLSEDGAGVQVEVHAASLESGELITLKFGTTTHRARVCWVRQEGSVLRAGLQFLRPKRFDPQTHQLELEEVRLDPDCVLKVPAAMALRRKAMPFARMDGVVHVACAEPDCRSTVRVMEKLFKAPVQIWPTEPDKLESILRRIFGDGRELSPLFSRNPTNPLQNLDLDVVELSEEILYAAYLKQASDIHLDPLRDGMRVRLRVDGQLETYAILPSAVQSELVNRFKILAGMDIAEKRAPQDGSFTKTFVSGARPIDLRVATLPTRYGERLTLRLLALTTDTLTLDRLGLSDSQRAAIERFLERKQGTMILTGPTGSGKTTTLYAAIRTLLKRRDLNLLTVEDPIEYEIDGVIQAEVDAADKVTFAKALRSMLRHDPDAIMVGEIRDLETADTAIKAALTGHLVFSTLHTNSAAGTITRLIDMGVAPYLVGASMRLAIAQRLVRRLCRHCRIQHPLSQREALALGKPELAGCQVYEGAGCIYCRGTGYHGRTGVYEVLEVDSDWAKRIAEGAKEGDILAWMRERKLPSLMDDAIAKLLAGETSASEVLRIVLSW